MDKVGQWKWKARRDFIAVDKKVEEKGKKILLANISQKNSNS